MKYSTFVKQMLMASIDELSQIPEDYAVHPDKDFTRNRKIGFHEFLLLLLTMENDSLKEELYRFFGRTDNAPTKAAFYHQRTKLKPDALWKLLQIFNSKLKPALYKNHYRLVACDGSVADIFRNEKDKDTYFEPNNKSPRGFNQIHINALYSIIDRQFLDVLVQPARKRNEYSAFCEMVDRVKNDYPTIYIADRGYASYNDFAHVLEKQQYFLIRCTDVKTSRLLGVSLDNIKELDCHVERILCRTKAKKKLKYPERFNDYRYVCQAVPMDFLSEKCKEYSLSLRIVRIEIAPGIYENLITNLPDIDFDMDELKELYHLRWSQETAYRDLKYPLCLKAFHSKKYTYIEQEVLARALMYNYCAQISSHVEISNHSRKWSYQVNFSQAVKICRDDLRSKPQNNPLNVESLIADNIEAIRPDRTFCRQARFKIPMSFCYR